MDKKNKSNKFVNIIVIIVSIAIIIVLCTFFLDTTGKINQGYFRMNDVVIYSAVDVQDKEITQSTEVKENTTAEATQENTNEATSNPINSLSDLTLNVSQKNEISFLVANTKGIDAASIYIDNLKINYPVSTENMYIYQNEKNKIDLKTENIKLDLTKEDRDGQFLIKIKIDNVNCVKDATIKSTDSSTVLFDGTILKILNTKLSDIKFDITFDLNIVDSTGKINTCKIKLNLPSELLVSNGISIISENPGKFPFRIK